MFINKKILEKLNKILIKIFSQKFFFNIKIFSIIEFFLFDKNKILFI